MRIRVSTPGAPSNRRRMAVALAINVVLLVATVVGGMLTDSLALLADAGHLLSDVGAIAIGLVAARLAGRAPTPARTYGLQRSEVLGALANGVLLVVIAVLIVVEALGRLGSPPDVAGGGMLALGLVGPGRQRGRHLGAGRRASARTSTSRACCATPPPTRSARSAWSWPAVLVLAAGWNAADPMASLVIAGLIAAGSWRLLKEPLDVLLEAAPAGTDVSAIGEAMAAEPDVVEVHDLHVWTVTSGFPALVAHVVVVAGCRPGPGAARGSSGCSQDRFGIHAHDAPGGRVRGPGDGADPGGAPEARPGPYGGRRPRRSRRSRSSVRKNASNGRVAPGGRRIAGDRADDAGFRVVDDVGVPHAREDRHAADLMRLVGRVRALPRDRGGKTARSPRRNSRSPSGVRDGECARPGRAPTPRCRDGSGRGPGIPGSISNTVAPNSSPPSRRPTCIMRMARAAVVPLDVPIVVVEVHRSSCGGAPR